MARSIKLKPTVLTKKLKSIKAKDIMTKEVITTTEDTPLADIAQTMIKARVSGLPVVNKKDKISGIITAGDLFIVMDMIKFGNIIANNMKVISRPTARFAMSTEVIKIEKNTTLEEIITIMKYKNAYTLPVFSANKMVGVIGRHDVFKNFYAVVKGMHL